jgi:tetratricopeptide (TPR) repeat protein
LRNSKTLGPGLARAHYHLGGALSSRGQVEEAIACCRKAIELGPRDAAAHGSLGAILCDRKRDYDGAIACFRKAIELGPKDARSHFNLGNALSNKGKLDDAITSYKKAIELGPKNANAHGALGQALLRKGNFAEARAATSRALELLPEKHPLRATVSRQVQTCERLAKLERRLPGLLKGEDKPASARESLDLGLMCHVKGLTAAATRFWAAAFAEGPELADDLKAAHRYRATCSAALAAAGKGEDAAKLDDKERARLRKQALDWLRADLAFRGKQMQNGGPGEAAGTARALAHWQKDADLAGLRDKAALAKLPAEERAACERLWADVAALLKKAETAAQKEGKP